MIKAIVYHKISDWSIILSFKNSQYKMFKEGEGGEFYIFNFSFFWGGEKRFDTKNIISIYKKFFL